MSMLSLRLMASCLSESDYELSQGVEIRHNGSAWDYANPADKAYWPTDKLDFLHSTHNRILLKDTASRSFLPKNRWCAILFLPMLKFRKT